MKITIYLHNSISKTINSEFQINFSYFLPFPSVPQSKTSDHSRMNVWIGVQCFKEQLPIMEVIFLY